MTAPFRIELDNAALVGERREGTGAPLVLIHGFGGSRHDWQPLISAMPADIPLITYDQRGFGDSSGEAGVPFSHAEDLLALLDRLQIDRIDLCGLSMGGATALHFALNWPDRVRKLVLISPAMVGWSWTSEWIERWKKIGRAARAGDMKTARVLWWEHPLFDPTRASPAADMLRESIAGFHGRQWVQDDQRPELPDIDRLTDLAVPTLLLTGGLDTEDFRLIADVIAGAGQDVARIDHADAGHLLNLEIPGKIAGDIASFLST
ncbi:alpha/beta fold hydrolase [Novosphingobium beihaiensis]|uniref:Alpha/beta hydrolase n=1 Tax=Novosphingobium beihaiensis TaxID=2930389 RepID=A0ABT0BTZ2_9SPHN|nr:alpha/beta hydrolase [Novosphingobium beihaiensis]MCJ2188497.1 alpha/beta hydrolase [Novosphingobium beihaiensis]